MYEHLSGLRVISCSGGYRNENCDGYGIRGMFDDRIWCSLTPLILIGTAGYWNVGSMLGATLRLLRADARIPGQSAQVRAAVRTRYWYYYRMGIKLSVLPLVIDLPRVLASPPEQSIRPLSKNEYFSVPPNLVKPLLNSPLFSCFRKQCYDSDPRNPFDQKVLSSQTLFALLP